ncbi:GEVED domain-containing protein [Streptomyces sp. TLI_053]|uniref:DUF7507 domain-containing protein n=1 Tax=Streptomyces sp. TLI_053 TaxID=1855352 RepID=UPI000D1B7349|nr:GEVED domain-containing protein [Streptomyces sp. TLI_053]
MRPGSSFLPAALLRGPARGLVAVLAALAVVLGAAPALAYEAPSGAGTGVTGFNGYRDIPFPSGMSMKASVVGNIQVQEGLTLSSIGSPAASHYQPQLDPTRAYAIRVRTRPQQDCPANSTCPAGTLTVTFKHPVRNPILSLAGLGAGANGPGFVTGTHSQLTLTGSDQPAELTQSNDGATLFVAGRTIRPRSGTAQANCQDGNANLRAGCGSVPVVGTVSTLTFAVDFVTQRVAMAASASDGQDDWALSALVRDDCSNAPVSYGNASHVIGDLTLGQEVSENVQTSMITQACRQEDDDRDLNPDFGTLSAGSAGRTYSLTVPVNGPAAGSAAPAYAAAWIDFDGSGGFGTAERATATVAPGQTSVTFTWTVPAGVVAGPTWSRFRLGYDQAQVEAPTGMADSGEVEDWPLTIGAAPALTLEKKADPATVGKAGDQVRYSFTVTNSGTLPITDPVVNETSFSGTGTRPQVSCPPGSVAPGASVTCTGTYTVTQADVDAGRIENAATATATPPAGTNPPVSNESTVTVTAPPAPDLALRKSAAETGALQVGEVVHYAFEITNTGNVTLAPVSVGETAFTGRGTAPQITCPAAADSLAPGAVVTCTAEYTVVQADVDAGTIENTATATGTPPGGGTPVTSDPSSTVVPFTPRPSLDVDKVADKQRLVAGETLTYTYTATNTGNVTLTDITVTETSFTGSGGAPKVNCPAGELAPGASRTCTATYTVTQADVDAGKIDNAATATGTPPGGGTPVTSPPATTTVTADRTPALTIAKSSDKQQLVAGEDITYTFTVTNTGNTTLTEVGVTETEWTGSGPAPKATCPAGPLAPGGQVRCTATYTITQQDADRGTLRNSATATGTPPGGLPPVTSPPDSVLVPHDSRPALTVAKKAEPATVAKAGEQVVYTFVLTNTGNVTLTDLKVTETSFSGSGGAPEVDCPGGPLTPGAVLTCTARYVVTQADVDAGRIDNAATATGTPPAGLTPPVSPEAGTTVTVPPRPHLTLRKTVAETTALQVGEILHYSFEVTNTGNVTMTDAGVGETAFTGRGTAPTTVCPDAAKSLAPGATVTCTAEYTVVQADVDAGTIENTATATGTPPGGGTPVTSPPSSTVVPFTPRPSLVVEKSADKQRLVAGERITYSYLVTNTGNVTLSDVRVDEGAFSGTGTLSPVSCPEDAVSLEPGRIVTCTAEYTVTQADVDAGRIDNAATATGTPPGGTPVASPPGTTTVPTDPRPALTVVKSSDKQQLVVGETITYTYTVTNTGNVTLTGVGVSETEWTGSGPAPRVTCPDAAKSLAPGAQVLCTATHTVTQDDADRGTVRNTATATGTPPGGGTPVTGPPSSVTVPHESRPAMVLEKKAEPATVTKAGERITYTFTVTNTGNITLTGVHPVESRFTGTGKRPPIACPPGSGELRPGQQLVCSTSYTATQADIDAGSISNTATATGTPPGGGTPVTSPPDTVTVTAPHHPALDLVKTADPASAAAGATVTYRFTLTNTGNVTIEHIAVREGEFSGTGTVSAISCPESALGVGQQLVCTATYRVTTEDAARGTLTNTATATGTPFGSNHPVTSPPARTTVTTHPAAAPTPRPAPHPAPWHPGVLPHTGAGVSEGLAGAALALTAGGGIALSVARRRRRRP